jgi:hypothetical protein
VGGLEFSNWVGYCANYYVYISYGTSRDKVGGGVGVGVAEARFG